MAGERIADDEILYRRIPPGETYFQPPDRITTGNFTLTDDDLGVSVHRGRIVGPAEALRKPGTIPGSRLAEVTAGQVRAAQNGKGEPLNLDVVAVDDEDDAGHAEIRGPTPGELSKAAAKALKRLFKLTQDVAERT